MNNTKNKKYKTHQSEEFSVFSKISKFIAVVLLRAIGSKSKSHQPNLQEQVMGEKTPFSDKHYIPDDKND